MLTKTVHPQVSSTVQVARLARPWPALAARSHCRCTAQCSQQSRTLLSSPRPSDRCVYFLLPSSALAIHSRPCLTEAWPSAVRLNAGIFAMALVQVCQCAADVSPAVQGLAAVSAQYRAVQQATAERLAAGLYARQASAPVEMLQSMIQAGAEDDPDVQAWHPDGAPP